MDRLSWHHRYVGPLVIGFSLGFFVAAQVGPISLLVMRTVLRGALTAGLAIGAGAAVIDASYAALGQAGAGALLRIDALRVALGAVGAVVLVALGARTLWSAFRVRAGMEADSEVATPRRAFLTSLAATASNPTTIASWAAIFAAATTAGAAAGGGATVLMLCGVAAGTATWFSALCGVLWVVRRRVGPRALRGVDVLAGLGLVVFGGVLGWRTLGDDG
jgi:threonine/homoserine/homoserine lactone efflux protein